MMAERFTLRFICTEQDPWTEEKGRFAIHPDAREIGEQDGFPGGDIVTYRCPHCEEVFEVELPQ